MPSTFAVYVPASGPGPRNLETGLNRLVWGWKDALLDRGNNRVVAESMRVGDLLVLATRGPNPRVKPGGWATAAIGAVHLARLTSDLRRETTPIWDDEHSGAESYPNRVSFKLVYETVDRRALHGEPSIAEALRLSANNQGRPEVVDLPGAGAPRIGLGTEGADLLEVEGPYDIAVLTLARREQRAIRARKLGKREQVTCDLCARTFPARLVRAAHIKRRSDCNSAERADLNNVMAACALGCDELFEQGYVAVDRGGRVVASRLEIGDVQSAVEALVGRACTAYSPASARFFAYHFEESSKSDGRVP